MIFVSFFLFFFFKQKTAYEMRISDWSSDVCSSDLIGLGVGIGDMDDRMVLPPLDHAVGAERAAPVGAEFEPPPMAGIAKVDGAGRLVKDQRAGARSAERRVGNEGGSTGRSRRWPVT